MCFYVLTHGRTDGERHTIIRPSKDRRITNPCLFHGPLFPEAPTHPFLLAVHSLVACLVHVSDIVSGIDRIQFDSWHAALFEYDRWNPVNMEINTLRLEQNGQHWAYESFFLKEKFWVKLHCSLFQMAVYAKYDSHVRHNSQSISNGSGNGFVPRRWHAITQTSDAYVQTTSAQFIIIYWLMIWAVWYKTKFGSQNFGCQPCCLFCNISNVFKNMFCVGLIMW